MDFYKSAKNKIALYSMKFCVLKSAKIIKICVGLAAKP